MKKLYFLLGGVSAIALMIVGLTTASAFGGEKPDNAGNGNGRPQLTQEEREQMREKMEEHRAQMETVFESGDYQAWKALVEERAGEMDREPKMLENITEENFAKFAEMHQLMKDGDKEGAKAIAEELDLPGMGMMGGKFKRSMGNVMRHGEFKDVNGDGVCNMSDFEEDQA